MPPAPDPTVDVADPEPDPGPVPLDLGEGGAAHGGLAAVLRRLAAIEVSQQAILHKLHEVHRGPEAPPRRRSSCSADLGKGPMAPISLADLPDLTHAADPGRAARERPVAYFDHATPRSPIHKPRDRPEFPIHKPRDRPECPRDPPPPDAAPADPPAPLRVLSLESNLNHEQKRRPSQIELHDKNSLSFEEDALAKQASNAADLVRLARTAHRQNGTLLKPDALWRQFWNLLWLLLCLAEGGLLLVCLVWVDLARWDQPLVHVLAGLYGASTVFFAADMALQFRTISRAMIESGSGTVSEARAHYLASLFAPDLLCTLPVAALLVPLGPQGFLAGAVLRLLRVERARHLLMWSDPLKQMPRHMYLQRFGFYLLFAIHVLVCGSMVVWRLTALHTPPDGPVATAAAPSAVFYGRALYWVMTCLSTVGFGDIYPVTIPAQMYAVVVMVFTIYMNVHLLSAGLAPALRRSVVAQEQVEKKEKLAKMLEHYDVPMYLRRRVFALYPHLVQSSIHDIRQVDLLPQYLQDTIYHHIKLRLIVAVPSLAMASADCANQLALRMKPVTSMPGECLMRQGDVGDCMFFLFQGIVQVSTTDEWGHNHVEYTLKGGSWFGEGALMDEVTHTATAESITMSSLFILSKADFAGVRREFPDFSDSLTRRWSLDSLPCDPAKSPESSLRHSPSPSLHHQNSLKQSPSPSLHQMPSGRFSMSHGVCPYVPVSCGVEVSSHRSNWSKVSHTVSVTHAFRQGLCRDSAEAPRRSDGSLDGDGAGGEEEDAPSASADGARSGGNNSV